MKGSIPEAPPNVRKLADRLDCPVILPGHVDYDRARLVHNRWHDLRPAAIVRPERTDDVRRALECASDAGIEVAIRGGGHHVGGFGSCNGGIVIDFSLQRSVDVDRDHSVARASPGARLRDVDGATSRHGLVVPTGTVSDTGIGGLALGGGIGWLIGSLGLTCDHLVGADVLLADGRIVRAEDPDHRDLIWALRGGGGNFGAVLQYRFGLSPLPDVVCGSLTVDWWHARSALNRLSDFLADACPRGLTVAPSLVQTGAGERALSVDFCLVGRNETVFEKLSDVIGQATVAVRTGIFPDWQKNFDKSFDPPMRCYWRAAYCDRIDETRLDAICDAFEVAPSRRCMILIEHLHGAYLDRDSEFAAFPHRDKKFGVLVCARWLDPADDGRHVEWARRTNASADPGQHAASYSNYAMPGNASAPARLFGASYRRLVDVKRKYDPQNLFRRNHNLGTPTNAGDQV